MQPTDILAICLREQERARAIVAGLRDCPIEMSRSTVRLGAYIVDRRTQGAVIRISRHLTDDAQVRDTIRHELAHQAAYELHGHFGHGALWQTWAQYLGCEPVRCSRGGIDPEIARSKQRYALICKSCGWSITRQHRSKTVRQPHRYACGRCKGSLMVRRLEPGVA